MKIGINPTINSKMKSMLSVFSYTIICILMTLPVCLSQSINSAIEPEVNDSSTINLLDSDNIQAWAPASDHWSFKDGVIIGDTHGESLKDPEWTYTKAQFSDFEFTCEIRLTGDLKRNTGIYYRVTTFPFKGNQFEAPSGYEFDVSYHRSGKNNFWGSLGDWYARPTLRIFADQELIKQTYEAEKWNRLTIRARGARLEYWINGIKVLDFIDDDPAAATNGKIGFQLHNGSAMKVEYRNIRVSPLF